MTGERTDFCVVGGGPAGLTAALLLARSGAKVTVVERSTSLEREYRGEILQPGGQALLAGLGVLDGARARGCHEHDRFLLEEHGRVLINGDYRRLPGPYNCLLSIPQRHLLAELLEHCHREQQFSYLGGAKVTGLVRDDGRIRGVVCRTSVGEQTVHAHCVVGADGRFSKVRHLAGIENERRDHFAQDVLWFRLRNRGDAPRDVRIFRAGGNPLLAYASVPDRIQLGWTLPHHGYRDLAARGLGYVKERLRAAVPRYADQIDAEITGFKDLSLLDVFTAKARQWVLDGLLLIGDSAHTQGPIGAQGINLAIQDAVAAHPVLLASLRTGDSSAGFLRRYADARQRDISTMTKIQRAQSKTMFSTGTVAAAVRPKLAMLVSRTPVYRAVLHQIAFGNRAIQLRADLLAH